MIRFLALFCLSAGLLVVAPACSSDDDSTTTGTGTSASTACAADKRQDIYTAGLTKPAGDLQVVLVDAQPGPPIKGMNTLKLELRDSSGAAVDGAEISVTPFMPDHAHGSARKPVVTAAGAGRYDVAGVWLPMAGLWKITVSVKKAEGAALQAAEFQFCLDG